MTQLEPFFYLNLFTLAGTESRTSSFWGRVGIFPLGLFVLLGKSFPYYETIVMAFIVALVLGVFFILAGNEDNHNIDFDPALTFRYGVTWSDGKHSYDLLTTNAPVVFIKFSY